MHRSFSRRDALRWMGVGGLALAHPALFAACAERVESAEPLLSLEPAFDPAQPWWMQQDFAPVLEERDLQPLEVEGVIPRALNGTYLRNGPNPKHGNRGHWFLGDGMLHAVRLEAGRALWYRNRFVRTPALERLPNEKVQPNVDPAENYSNVSVVQHAGRLLSLGEAGLPYEVTSDLRTLGVYDFAGRLKTWMTAHPRLDPSTGEMHMFGYAPLPPFLTYHVVDSTGQLLRSEVIDIPRPVMMHDFQLTERYVVFLDLPIVLSVKMALDGAAFPYAWDPENGARIGLMPRAGGNAEVTWFEIEPCFIFHTLNAYDDEQGQVVLEACRMPDFWSQSSTELNGSPVLHRYTLDLARKTVKLEALDDRLVEFPHIDRRVAGRKHRYGYTLFAEPEGRLSGSPIWRGVIKYDRVSGAAVVNTFEKHRVPGELYFVPAAPDAAEDEGWLLSFVFDRRTQRSALEILDAQRIDAAPVARIKLQQRVPAGAHGLWVPA